MQLPNTDNMSPDELAPLLLACLQRLGQLGREGATALAAQVDDGDADFDEAADWVSDISAGTFTA
jgi:hypothetical protein